MLKVPPAGSRGNLEVGIPIGGRVTGVDVVEVRGRGGGGVDGVAVVVKGRRWVEVPGIVDVLHVAPAVVVGVVLVGENEI